MRSRGMRTERTQRTWRGRIEGPVAWALALAVFAAVPAGCGPPAPKHATVGVLNDSPMLSSIVAGFKDGMVDSGYDSGLRVDYLYDGPILNGDAALVAGAQKLVAAGADLILALGTQPTLCAKQATATAGTPIVFALVDDPVGQGFVQTLAHPAGRITGVTHLGLMEAPRLRWLLELVPGAKRIYVPYNPTSRGTAVSLPLAREAADKLGVEFVMREVGDVDGVRQAIAAIPPDVDAVFLPPDTTVTLLLPEWIQAALDRKLPLCVGNEFSVQRGALMSYGFSFIDAGKQAARLANQVLRGARPGDLPVEIPDFHLTINLRTAEVIGLQIPDEILRQADDVIR